jgi:hypothetical protein
MECAVPWQRFEPSKCVLGQRQQNKRYPSAEYMGVSYKDSMVEMPAIQIVTPWLNKPAEFTLGESSELSWSATDHAFFHKIKMLHEQIRSFLLTNHRIKVNAPSYTLTVYLDKSRTSIKSAAAGESVTIEEATKNSQQQYKLCIRLAGIHLQHGCANYRFKCIGVLLR